MNIFIGFSSELEVISSSFVVDMNLRDNTGSCHCRRGECWRLSGENSEGM